MLQAVYHRYRAAYAGLPRDAWVLALALLVNRAGAMVLPFLTLYLTSEIGMSEAAAGWMISVFGLGAIVGAYGGGRLVERVGAVRLQTVCLFLTAPTFLLMAAWRNPWAIAASVFGLSVVSAAVRPANATAIALATPPEDRTRAFALQRLAANLGFSFGPAVGGVLATIDFGLLFVVDAVTTLLAAIVMLVYFRFGRLAGEAPHKRPAPLRASPLEDRQYVAFLALVLASSCVFLQIMSTYPLYLRDHYALSKPYIGAMFAVNTVIIVVFEMLLIDGVKRWPLARTIGWGAFLSCLGFALLPLGSTLGFAVFAMLVLTVGEMLSIPLTAGYVANRAPRGQEGRYMGWLAVTTSCAAVIGPAVGAYVYAVNPTALWGGCFVVGSAVLIGFYRLPADGASDLANDGAIVPSHIAR